ncbi:uncharacterized protein LOC127866330 [Dreissena polymorpha]|uniref:SOCS box domain-containing protein n=1 Tax=Dreissena polymorpha TaxID=45954 RepID=A0A9D4LQA6_DREPO|nr:uncharacterized protein LOC127866330 [Dreissena polymorpha]XP_052262762.1 uncharacterized protein LOC127866330 [Dreissena polymorpha]XP_052262763.1 uncharacterized protein LOC127866330 [Dreissena polymorpha]XP_052262764.1 uncharacterized protein LOC127866330 [Dreissena polymorpha]XP_052262765.1 uncharacterized protein LOC127866330 [Dreissena polymorpha]KAH3862733.1 hypothetical protein DPMN_025706 [Dreissena polymorpha]
MGAEESKPGSPCFGLMGPSSVISNMNRQAQMARAWALLHQCSIEQWKLGHGEAAGFGEKFLTCGNIVFKDCSPRFCTSQQSIINIPTTARIFGFRKRKKFTKMAEHFEYKVVPAQMSCIQNFQVMSVLCVHENMVVLHLKRNMTTQFGAVNLSSDKFLGVFGVQLASFENDALRGKISPDCSLCLIKLPYLQGRVANGYILELYDLKSKTLLSQYVLPYTDTTFAFDPRFNWTHLAATSFLPGSDNSLSIVQVKSWEVKATNPRLEYQSPSQSSELKDIVYSRDGHLIFAVFVTAGCHCRERRSRRTNPVDISIYVFNADTADTLHCVQYHRFTCGVHLCPVNYMPIFSHCGSRMAIALNDLENALDHVQIYKLPSPMSLQSRCRTRIIQRYGPDKVKLLPLPKRIIQFLLFHPEFE